MASDIDRISIRENRISPPSDPVIDPLSKTTVFQEDFVPPAEKAARTADTADRPVLPQPAPFSPQTDGKSILDNLAIIMILFHKIMNQLRMSQVQEFTNLALARTAELKDAADKKKEASHKLMSAAIAGVVLASVSAALSVSQMGVAAKASKAGPSTKVLREAKDAQKAAQIGGKLKNLDAAKPSPPPKTPSQPEMKPEAQVQTGKTEAKIEVKTDAQAEIKSSPKEGTVKNNHNDGSDTFKNVEEKNMIEVKTEKKVTPTDEHQAKMDQYNKKLEKLGVKKKDSESYSDLSERLDRDADTKNKLLKKEQHVVQMANVLLSSQQTASVLSAIPGQFGQAQSTEKQAEGDEIAADAEKTKAHEDLANSALQAFNETAQTIRQMLGEMIQADYQAKSAIAKI